MTEIPILTTQNVHINFEAASVGNRMGAYLLDLTIKYAYLIFVFQMIFPALGVDSFNWDYWSGIAVHLIFYAPVIFYTLIQEIWFEGQTVGKRILGLKVVKIDGYQASVWDYVIRWLFRVVDIIGPFFVIGIITMSTSKWNQRLGDIAAGTAVISIRSRYNISHTILENLVKDYIPRYPAVIRLNDNDIRIIKERFISAGKNRDIETLHRIANKIESVLNIRRETSEAVFIDTIIKDYNYYTGEG